MDVSDLSTAAWTLVAMLLVLLLWFVPRLQVRRMRYSHLLNQSERFDKENEARKTMAQILGGLAFLAGLYSTTATLRTSQEGQITDRFSKAIDHLGAVNQKGETAVELRLGGIYALERVARDSRRDHWPIMEILTAYVRRVGSKRTAGSEGPAPDVQAALTVIGRRNRRYERDDDPKIDLSNTDIHGANLANLHYENANLERSGLENSTLLEAHLEGAHLVEARLNGATLMRAHLQHADLRGACVEGTDLQGTHLEGADLRGARGLIQAQIDSAIKDGTTQFSAMEKCDRQ